MTINANLSHPKYRPDIDGLRAVAVLAVVVFHAFPDWLEGGFIGVDVFFVISGFLISSLIFENLDKGTFSFSEFYARRIRRIFPALLVMLISSLIFGWFALLPDELNQLGKHAAAGAGFVSNIVLWSEVGYFDSAADKKPLLHLWSLGIEEQFYMVWPLIVWLAWKKRFNILFLLMVAVLFSMGLNVKIVHQYPEAAFYSPATRFWELLCGSVLAWFSLYEQSNAGRFDGALRRLLAKSRFQDGNLNRMIRDGFSVFGLLLVFGGFFILHENLSFPGFWACIPVMGALLVIWAGPEALVNRKLLANRMLVWIGLISFPLYLWHWPILAFGHIIYSGVPPFDVRIISMLVSVLLAWLTVKFIEKPLRFGNQRSRQKVAGLSILMLGVALAGFVVYGTDFSRTHTFDNRLVKRKAEISIGSSLAWCRGRDNWLFLGNAHDNTFAKLKLLVVPSAKQIKDTTDMFARLSRVADKEGTQVALIVGPDKSSIYPEYLPAELVPSPVRYSGFFIEALKNVPGLVVYDPTEDLREFKKKEGIIYWKTDTHWNDKGAFLAFAGFLKLLDLPPPQVSFVQGRPRSGDLIELSGLSGFPLSALDNWDVVWKEEPAWSEEEIPGERKTTFGLSSVVTNRKPLSEKYVWVIGDSFTAGLRQYFNAAFKEIRYVGHWNSKLADLPAEFSKADRKPDLIVIVRVERSF
ncbi:MAG TPA: acyltransferase family protein [Fluviicoccus sp.]|nr:acyltransferase family protein [Fluviicoccus sp.]